MRLVRALCKAAPNAMGSALATLDKSQQPADAATDAPETDSEEDSDNDSEADEYTAMQQDWGDTFEHGSGSLQELLHQLPAAVSRNRAPVAPPMAQLVDVLHSLGADSR